MTPSIRREETPLAVPAAALRCPRCGRRVASECPEHGVPEVTGGDRGSLPAVEIAPRIPGHRLRRLVARGGFGAVFEGVRESDGATVAIKVARDDPPEAGECLAREIAALTSIGAPDVPAVLAQGRTDTGAPYLVMEYLGAPTLADRLTGRASPLPPGEAGRLALALLDVLERVHVRGYAHRDLKPENIFVDGTLDDTRRAILVDFGLAAPLEGAAPEVTMDGVGAGTVEYMAPELCEGASDVDARADLYSVGVILFEMLTGRPPFWGARAVVQEGHLSRRPPRVSAMETGHAISTALEDVVSRALAKARDERFPSASAMRAALEAALRAAPSMPPPSRSPTPSEATRGERVIGGLVFFETGLDVASIEARLRALGGQLGEIAGRRCVAVFTEDSADNPVRRAHRAAEELIRLGACERARVDLAALTARTRYGGGRVFMSALFSRADRFPSTAGPEGVQIAPAAAEVLEDVDTLLPPLRASVGPLIGREAILASLVGSARRAASAAAPTVVRVIGEAGMGKSHLARALAEQLAGLGGSVITLRAREPALGDIDRALADLLVRALDLPASPPPDGGGALLRERLAAHADLAPAVALGLGWSKAGGEASPASAAPGALRSTLLLAGGAALRRRAAAGPLFVIVDDAHFAGPVALDALEYAALAEVRAPLWICALGRPLFERERPAWGQRAAHRMEIEVGPLDPGSAATLCRRLLLPVESAPESAVLRLTARAQNNPLYLVELVRGLHREGIARKSPKGEAWYLATDELDQLPDSPLIEWLARREIDALAPALREHARLLSLLGERVHVAEIEGVLHVLEQQGGDVEFPLDARIGTRRLVSAGVIVEDDAGRVSFRNALVREAVAHAVPEEVRRRIHAAAAEHYAGEMRVTLGGERRLAQLAHHAGEAGLADEAACWYFILAERARTRHAYTDAELLYSRALEQSAGAPVIDRRAAHRGRGLMRYRIGRYHDALADLERARALAAEAGDVAVQIDVLLDEATVLDWMDEYQASSERVEEARALLPEAGSPLLTARLLLGLGRSALRFGRNEEAAGLLERAAATAERLGDHGYETLVIVLLQLGFLLSGLGRIEDGRRALDRSVALAEEHGDRLHLGSALNVRGMLWAHLGDERRLVADMDRSIAIARELGQASLELMGEFNVAEFLLFLGDAAAAETHVRRAQALDRHISGDAGRADVALLEARLHLHRGEERAAGEIVARLRAREAPLLPSDDVLCAMIELSVRGAAAAAWDALEERAARGVLQELIEVIEARGAAAERRGRAAEARACFERALALAERSSNAMRARLGRRLRAGRW